MQVFLPIIMLWLAVTAGAAAPAGFNHPGLLHTEADLRRMQTGIAQGLEPWRSGFLQLSNHPASQASWRVRGGFEIVSRDPRTNLYNSELAGDANAAYQNALMWQLTDETAHAEKSIAILNAWSAKLRVIAGHDMELAASLYGFKYINAAELLRHSKAGWAAADIQRFERMLQEVFLPAIKDFAPHANGNWGTGCIKTMLAMGVFLDDRKLFDTAVAYYHRGAGNGCLTNYIINETGQCQESGRDQQHTQLGLGHLAEAAEIAWNQGVDLYSAADNRLLRGFEYTAKYNLGQEVPFVPHTDTTGKYRQRAIATQGRNRLRPIYEMVWNHYENRRGIPAPFSKLAAEKIRPEGAAWNADHPGFGTLFFSRPAMK